MPSQNESIFPYAILLGFIIDWYRLNLYLIMEEDMAMRAKKDNNLLPLSVFITDLCG